MKTCTQKFIQSLCAAALTMCVTNAPSEVLFTDSYDTNASSLWSNLRGNWFATNGVYAAANPQNVPPTFTGLPFVLTNFGSVAEFVGQNGTSGRLGDVSGVG